MSPASVFLNLQKCLCDKGINLMSAEITECF